MLANSLYFVVSRFGDLLGTNLYDHFGSFDVCVIAITIVYALIAAGHPAGSKRPDRDRGWADRLMVTHWTPGARLEPASPGLYHP